MPSVGHINPKNLKFVFLFSKLNSRLEHYVEISLYIYGYKYISFDDYFLNEIFTVRIFNISFYMYRYLKINNYRIKILTGNSILCPKTMLQSLNHK